MIPIEVNGVYLGANAAPTPNPALPIVVAAALSAAKNMMETRRAFCLAICRTKVVRRSKDTTETNIRPRAMQINTPA
jgi:hypothetical protein